MAAGKSKGTKEKLIEAGLKLFSEKGYLGASTKDIAARAGVAELTLFRHFPKKEDLFEEVVNTYTFLPALKGLLPEIKEMDYREALPVIARRFLRQLSDRRDLIRIMQSEFRLYPEQVREIYHNCIGEVFSTLASYFKGLQEKGVLRRFNAEYAARAFLGMFFSYFNSREFILLEPLDEETVICEYTSLFVNGTLAAKGLATGARAQINSRQKKAF
ncbi:MAG: TetR/AcrR family transcriptional regulator [Nitrospiraceae bacterium]|nr:TetR/AcrR family transcriptional regulator [Nitrospiraceae bacterium]